MPEETVTKEIDGRLVYSIPVDREGGYGTGDCVNYGFIGGDSHLPKDLKSFIAGRDMEIKSGHHHCELNLNVSEKCYATCPEFGMSSSIPGKDMQRHGIPEIDFNGSYYAYFYPQYTGNRMFVTAVKNGFDREEVTETANFIVKNLKTLLT